ncbi:uncharacterized protein LOC111390913 [Olea europaea var. sylvestris]|uniref:uncharacterized protein LOC111390913 n=1 Tax=Olea europaea var. sylvestris TaxID=158386 RepID=UPI000C1D3EF2|nr:uncharacterized protein LOC111390913 [Olea europaea var. sylvestris]
MANIWKSKLIPLDPWTRIEGGELEGVRVCAKDQTKELKVGCELQPSTRSKIVAFLKQNLDVFAVDHSDIRGIDPSITCHKLQVDPSVRPKQQKRRPLNPERYEALNKKVQKLLNNGFLREAKYSKWVANSILVKKHNGDWMISMYGLDQEHTSFVTDRGLYCYRVMPFGLKNAGATYQRLVNSMFFQQIGKTMEVYVDDMLVKSIKAKDHCRYQTEMFDILRKYGMKLNPRKCGFGVSSGRFLGYIVNNRGIEANPEKIQAVIQMKSPTKPREVQSLTGRVAILSRFISKFTDRCKPFFDTLRGGKKFEWTKECQDAFNELKRQLARPPLLSKPKASEALKLYLSISEHAISSVLTREENGVQHLVYYVRKALHEAELRYSPVEKLAFTLLIAARKLRPYFLEHTIEVLTNSPLRQTLQKLDTSGCMKETPWKLYVDGSSTEKRSGVDVVLISPDHRIFYEALPFDFKASNNEAEYEALIAGARMSSGLGISDLILHSNSQLVMNQNGHADALARLATSEGIEEFDSIPVGRISLPSTELAKVVLMMIDPKPTWQDDIIAYLKIGKYLENSVEARKLRIRSARYTHIDNILYKRGYSTPLLWCLNEGEAQHALQDVHEGICGNHSSGLSLAHKIIRQ